MNNIWQTPWTNDSLQSQVQQVVTCNSSHSHLHHSNGCPHIKLKYTSRDDRHIDIHSALKKKQATHQNPKIVQNFVMFEAICKVRCKVKFTIALMLLLLLDHSQRNSVQITSTRKNCTLGNALRSVCKSLRALYGADDADPFSPECSIGMVWPGSNSKLLQSRRTADRDSPAEFLIGS